MSYKISQQVRQPSKIEFLGVGDVITPRTMEKMKSIINDSIRDYYVRRWAEKIVERAGRTDSGKLTTIYNFIYNHTNYMRDPFGLELLKTPQVSLQLFEVGEVPGLDCDDLTILSLSLLKAIGYPVALRAVGFSPVDDRYTHVYGLVRVPNVGWVSFDLVKGIGIGNDPPGVKRVWDMEV